MPEQLDPRPTEALPPAVPEGSASPGKDGAGATPQRDIKDVVESAPEEVGEAVAANEKAWQAALRARARGDTEVARRVRAAGLIGDGPMDGSRRDPFWERDDVLMCTPEQMELIADLNWAEEQDRRGTFAGCLGRYVVIVNRTVQGIGADPGELRDEASRRTGVLPERVALYYVDPGE